jgi:molybdenum cofactor cytidylyltransferase
MHTIHAVVLASGRSSRMGRPKALLPFGTGGPSFLAVIARTLRAGGVVSVMVAGRPGDEALEAEAAALESPVRFVANPRADEGQLLSILAALDLLEAQQRGYEPAARGPLDRDDGGEGHRGLVEPGPRRPSCDGLLVLPIDQPLVQSASIARLLEASRRSPDAVVRAVHDGRHGHPVIFPSRLFPALRRADPLVGARAVLRAHPEAVLDCPVDDPGVTLDVDTPDDYRRLIDRIDARS